MFLKRESALFKRLKLKALPAYLHRHCYSDVWHRWIHSKLKALPVHIHHQCYYEVWYWWFHLSCVSTAFSYQYIRAPIGACKCAHVSEFNLLHSTEQASITSGVYQTVKTTVVEAILIWTDLSKIRKTECTYTATMRTYVSVEVKIFSEVSFYGWTFKAETLSEKLFLR